jgi:N-acetylneuraminate synthase
MKPYLVAEIGCNHKGDLEIAKEMIRMISQFCKVPCVKFQKRNPKLVLTPEEYAGPHPEPRHSYGSTYGEHREALEFSLEEHRTLQRYCQEWNVEYSCSVWDMESAQEVVSLRPMFVKVPSACNTHFELASFLCDSFPGQIHVSLGMVGPQETERIVDFYRTKQRANDLVLYHCTSGYPVPFEDICLLDIKRLQSDYGSEVAGIGFSGHHLGIAVDLAAFALGATYIERHFTLDRTWKGTDHAASLEPDGLRRLWRDLQATAIAMTWKPQSVLDVEQQALRKLRWDRVGAPTSGAKAT